MSARAPRRRFASPFVVTLAAAGSAACTNPPRPEPPTSNPPPPGQPEEPEPTPTPTPEPTVQPPTTEPTTAAPGAPAPVDAKREPAKFEMRWTVSKLKGQADCQAFLDPNCPKPEKGKPVPTCNPPPPTKYACPADFADGQSMKIILRVGATECFEQQPAMRCPENAKCNPPPPRKVECPKH
jgi:hypothetical protein